MGMEERKEKTREMHRERKREIDSKVGKER